MTGSSQTPSENSTTTNIINMMAPRASLPPPARRAARESHVRLINHLLEVHPAPAEHLDEPLRYAFTQSLRGSIEVIEEAMRNLPPFLRLPRHVEGLEQMREVLRVHGIALEAQRMERREAEARRAIEETREARREQGRIRRREQARLSHEAIAARRARIAQENALGVQEVALNAHDNAQGAHEVAPDHHEAMIAFGAQGVAPGVQGAQENAPRAQENAPDHHGAQNALGAQGVAPDSHENAPEASNAL